jgi:hypothetical protein
VAITEARHNLVEAVWESIKQFRHNFRRENNLRICRLESLNGVTIPRVLIIDNALVVIPDFLGQVEEGFSLVSLFRPVVKLVLDLLDLRSECCHIPFFLPAEVIG